MKIVTLILFVLFLTGCNLNPSKEARIKTLENEIQNLQLRVTNMEAKMDSLNRSKAKQENKINSPEKE